jgi:hypothetical protein
MRPPNCAFEPPAGASGLALSDRRFAAYQRGRYTPLEKASNGLARRNPVVRQHSGQPE